MSSFRQCMRLEWFRYGIGLRPIVTPEQLRIGSAFHEGLDIRAKGGEIDAAVDGAMAKGGYTTYPRWANDADKQRDWQAEAADIACMLRGYFWFWEREDVAANITVKRVIASEIPFEIPLRNPSGRASRTWRVAGKMDRIVELGDGRIALKESKTTGDSVAPDSDYWPPLRLDAQISLYFKAGKLKGYPIDTILYDVARKPKQKPKSATPTDKRKYKKDGTLYANQRDTDESIDDYAARVWSDITAAPETYFARQEIPRTSSDLADFDDDLWALSQLMHTARKNNWHPRNPSACRKWGRLCEHAGHCATFRKDGVVPSGFEIVEDCNPELEGAIQ